MASYFLAVQGAVGAAKPLTNLKLQKLCYYAQGFSLGKLGRPLFLDDIQRWNHGPVIPNLYQQYKTFGNKPIPAPDNLNLGLFSAEVRGVLNSVIQRYGGLSAQALRNQTHKESPWKNTPDGGNITYPLMRSYFEPLVADVETNSGSGQLLRDRMAGDAEFVELAIQGFQSDRRSRLEDVRRKLGDA